jgi:hemoglobin-like flavoprotein
MYEDALFQAHAKSLFGMVDVLVRLLNSGKTSSLAGALVTLGGQHFGYGVRAAHYPIVGKALMYVLEKVLKKEFTKEAKSGWKQLYTVVSTGMVSTNIVVWVTGSDVVHRGPLITYFSHSRPRHHFPHPNFVSPQNTG